MTLFDRRKPKVQNAVFAERPSGAKGRTSWLAMPALRIPAIPAAPPPRAAEPELPEVIEPHLAAPLPPPMPEGLEQLAAQPWVPPAERDELTPLLDELRASIDDFVTLRLRVLAESERQLVELSGAIARRVIGAELAHDHGLVLALAAEGVRSLAERDHVTVRIGVPLEQEALERFFRGLESRATHCEVVHDRGLRPGQCVVETDLGRVDESLETRLDNVLNHLIPRAPEGAGEEP